MYTTVRNSRCTHTGALQGILGKSLQSWDCFNSSAERSRAYTHSWRHIFLSLRNKTDLSPAPPYNNERRVVWKVFLSSRLCPHLSRKPCKCFDSAGKEVNSNSAELPHCVISVLRAKNLSQRSIIASLYKNVLPHSWYVHSNATFLSFLSIAVSWGEKHFQGKMSSYSVKFINPLRKIYPHI